MSRRRHGRCFPDARSLVAVGAVCMLAIVAAPASAYFEESDGGARAAGFARAFVAVADDATALYWNPAGLGLLKRPELVFTYSRPYAVAGMFTGYVAGAMPAHGATLGASWHHTGVSGALHEDLLSVGAGRTLASGHGRAIRIGGTLKLAQLGFPAYDDPDTGERIDFGSASKLTADLGILVSLAPQWTVGYAVHNLGSPAFSVLDDAAAGASKLPTLHQAGVAFQWNPESMIAMSVHQTGPRRALVDLGGEIWFYQSFAIRMGLTGADAGGGISLKSKATTFDFSFLTSEALGVSYRAGLRVPFGKEPR